VRRSFLVAAVVAASAALILRAVAQRLRHEAESEGATPDFEGHPWFAATYDLVNRWTEPKVVGRLRQSILGQATGQVVEIGIGTGVSLPYYRRAEKVVGVEPDPFMLRRARKRAQQLGLDIEFHQAKAEALPFPDASFDTVVAILVFCTVATPSRALAEVRRVLKPNGTFRFIEHVRAEGDSAARVQDILTPAYQRISAGCHMNRRTAEYVEAAGFEIIEKHEEHPDPLTPIIAGVARPR
jgi:ubiquinone/menaquinone biosynthesis C-methylase UbiE